MKRFHIQWHILDRCNLRCRHCYQEEFSPAAELPGAVLRLIADNLLATMGRWQARLDVAVTGGEPLLSEETLPLLAHLDSHERTGDLCLITNGLLLEGCLPELGRLRRLREIRVSLEGATAAANDALRGPGSFRAATRQIESAAAAGIPLLLMWTVMKSNLGEALPLLGLARSLGACGVVIERFFPLGTGRGLAREVLSGAEFLGLWRRILDCGGLAADPGELLPYRGIKVLLRPRGMEVLGSECIVGRDGGAVMPDGGFLPCRRLPLAAGNLLRQSLEEIWSSSPLLAKLRDRANLKGACRDCPETGCIGCRAMCYALTGDPLAEDPHCWRNRG